MSQYVPYQYVPICNQFIESGLKLIDGFENLSEVLRIQKKGMIKSIKCYAGISKNKNQVISKAYNSGGYAMRRDRIFF